MKILIPTAKQLSETAMKLSDKNSLSSKTKIIVNELHSKTVEEISAIYKISNKQAQIVQAQFIKLHTEQSELYKAIELFDGLMYRNISRKNLDNKSQKYLDENVLITSSLYGIIPSNYPISKHRLDFLQAIKINGETLKNYWRDEYDQAVSKDELIISLLSSEFEEVFSKTQRDNFIKVIFMENKNGVLKTHSTISKKARGKFLSELIRKQIDTIEEIKKVKFDGFDYNSDLSEKNKLVFTK